MPQTAELNWLLIDRVHPETHDVTTIVAVPARGKRTLAFAPGQFCMLAAPGAGEIPISISGDPSRPDRLTFTIRATGVSSSALASRRPGDAISMRGPVGNGWPLEAAFGNDVLLIAGGMGLAALRPIVYTILQNRANFGRLSILCGARTPADLIYKAELARLGPAERDQRFYYSGCTHPRLERQRGTCHRIGGYGRAAASEYDRNVVRPRANDVGERAQPHRARRRARANLFIDDGWNSGVRCSGVNGLMRYHRGPQRARLGRGEDDPVVAMLDVSGAVEPATFTYTTPVALSKVFAEKAAMHGRGRPPVKG